MLADATSDEEEEEDDDDNEKPSSRPYMTLLQSFVESEAPKAKRRKISYEQSAAPETEDSLAAEDESEGDAVEQDVDHVDEPEDPTIGLDEQSEPDSDDGDNLTDPFDLHFAQPDENTTGKLVNDAKTGKWTTTRAMLQSLRATIMTPQSESEPITPQIPSGLGALKLKQKLRQAAQHKLAFGNTQKAISPALFNYQDVLHCNRTVENANQLRQIICLHTLNHVFKYAT
jgi:U3 small nucleolar RNA-associated protein 25